MQPGTQQRRWFWATLTLSSVSIVAVVFAAWEVVENRLFSQADYVTLHYLYITRGITSSLLLAFWAAWYVLRERRLSEEALRMSHERYRGLLEASPGAVALYDGALRVSEWNAAAERLYGLAKAEVIGYALPTVPPEKDEELRGFLDQVRAGEPVLNRETLRQGGSGNTFEVQLSLLPFRDASGQNYFLEVTEDIRERVRLRQTLLEVEKLTSMGRMAAGTAHHLNTPLAAMLLRVQMMREHSAVGPFGGDLERLESGIRSCRQFVQRLLDFSRRPPVRKQPEEIAHTLQSVLSFLAPAVLAKPAEVTVNVEAAAGDRVLADRNLLEVLFSVLLSNALDAVPAHGRIGVGCRRSSADSIEIRIADSGCGIDPADLQRVFEPFFTTKGAGKGTGLGLAIARNVVLEHGGSIRLESAPGEGTTAIVELPLCANVPVGERAGA
jgi:PAS domain S-box-containing protein